MSTARESATRRLARSLVPHTQGEQEALTGLNEDRAALVLAMVQRAIQRAWLSGAEVGRQEVEEEHASPPPHV